MELTINTEKKTYVSALVVADIIAGRPTENAPAEASLDTAFEAADAFFKEKDITDRESYLKFRDELKSGLRSEAVAIRKLKSELRYLDGNDADFYSLSGELHRRRKQFKELHDTRRLGKAWSAEARKKTLENEAQHAVS